MGYPEFKDPDIPMSLDQEFHLWDKPMDESICPRCFSAMKIWDKKCKVCGYVEGEDSDDTDLGTEEEDDDVEAGEELPDPA